MSPTAVRFPEDQRVVACELVVHLGELRRREVVDPRQLDQIWLEVRQCDSAALESLEADLRRAYLHVAEVPRRPRPRAGDRSALRFGQAHLRVAIHRRLMVLHLVARPTTGAGVSPGAPR